MSMHSALLAVDVGAAKTRRVSWMVGVILVNSCRFTGSWIAYKSVVSYVRQSACFCVQPRRPPGNDVLLTYSQSDLSTALVVGVGVVWVVGCVTVGCVTGVPVATFFGLGVGGSVG
jgi:Tfp pilus assembly protein PilZ